MKMRTSALLALCAGLVLVGIFVSRRPPADVPPRPAEKAVDDVTRRRQSIAALALRPDGVPALIDALKGDELREDAAAALRRSGERANAPLLLLAQEQNTASEVRAAALGALTPVAANAASLTALLTDSAAPVRGAAARALGGLRHAPSVDAIAPLLLDSATSEDAEKALIAIGPPSVDRVARIYADRKAPISARQSAAEILGMLGDAAVLPLVRVIEKGAGVEGDAFEADNVTIDTTALSAGVDALSRIGTPAAEKALARLVEDEHPYAYDQALTALTSKQSDERMRLLLRFMKRCVDPFHCQPIGEALAGYGQAVQSELMGQLRSGSWDEDGPRTAAAVALGRIGTDEAVDALLSALRRERDNDVREVYEAVAEALTQCKNPRAAAFVSERVARRDFRFIAGAYGTLKERIGSDLILKALNEEGGFVMASGLINDPDPVLRNGARRWAEDNGHRIEEWRAGKTITP